MRRAGRSRRRVSWFVLALGVGWPAVALVRRAVRPLAGRPGLRWDTVMGVLGQGRTWRVVGQTLAQALVSAVGAGVIGVVMAVVVVRGGVRGGRRVLDLTLTSFVMPALVMGTAVRELAGWSGVASDHPWVQIVVAHVLFNIGFVASATAPAIEAVSGAIDDAVRVLGGSRHRAWATTARMVGPAAAQATGIVFVLCVTSFGIVLALGGAGVTTLEVEIWFQATRLVDLPVASVLSLLQLVMVAVGLMVIHRIGASHGRLPTARPRRVRSRWGPTVAVWLVAAAVVGAPLAALIRAAVWRDGIWTVEAFVALRRQVPGMAGSSLDALGRSTFTSIAVALVAVVIAMILLVDGAGRWVRGAATVPLAASAATVGLAYFVAWSDPVDLRGTWWLVAVVQTAVVVPVALAVVAPAFDRPSRSGRDVAATLGAGRARRLVWIWWPTASPAVLVALGLAAAASLGELGATTLVATDATATAPVVMQRLLARPGASSAAQAAALGAALMAMAATLVATSRWAGARSPGRRSARSTGGVRSGVAHAGR